MADSGSGRVDELVERPHPHRERQHHRGDAGQPATAHDRDQLSAGRAEHGDVVTGQQTLGLERCGDRTGLVVDLPPRHVDRAVGGDGVADEPDAGAESAAASRRVIVESNMAHHASRATRHTSGTGQLQPSTTRCVGSHFVTDISDADEMRCERTTLPTPAPASLTAGFGSGRRRRRPVARASAPAWSARRTGSGSATL